MQTEKPIANPLIVLREEFDDWAILFDPDTGDAFGLNAAEPFKAPPFNLQLSGQTLVDGLQNSGLQ